MLSTSLKCITPKTDIFTDNESEFFFGIAKEVATSMHTPKKLLYPNLLNTIKRMSDTENLQTCIKYQHIAESLIKNIDISQTADQTEPTPLTLALSHYIKLFKEQDKGFQLDGHKAIIEQLIDHNINVATTNQAGQSPLLLIINAYYDALNKQMHLQHHYEEIIKKLIRHGADANMANDMGITPLMLSTHAYLEHIKHPKNKGYFDQDNTNMVKWLIKQGADINKQNKNEHTALDFLICAFNQAFSKNKLPLATELYKTVVELTNNKAPMPQTPACLPSYLQFGLGTVSLSLEEKDIQQAYTTHQNRVNSIMSLENAFKKGKRIRDIAKKNLATIQSLMTPYSKFKDEWEQIDKSIEWPESWTYFIDGSGNQEGQKLIPACEYLIQFYANFQEIQDHLTIDTSFYAAYKRYASAYKDLQNAYKYVINSGRGNEQNLPSKYTQLKNTYNKLTSAYEELSKDSTHQDLIKNCTTLQNDYKDLSKGAREG